MNSTDRANLKRLAKSQTKLKHFFYEGESNLRILNETLRRRGGLKAAPDAATAARRLVKVAEAALDDEVQDPESVVAFMEKLSRAYQNAGVTNFPYHNRSFSSWFSWGGSGSGAGAGTGVKYGLEGGKA